MGRRHPHWIQALAWRIGLLAATLLAAGLLSAGLVRMAPGYGMDERMLDARLSEASIQALQEERAVGSRFAAYYWDYLTRLLRGDWGISVSLNRPVKELVAERLAVTARSAAAGSGLAWTIALATVVFLELANRRIFDSAMSVAAGALLCVPAAVAALACFYVGAAPALAIALILFPRLFRYLRGLARNAARAPHVFAARSFGLSRRRVLLLYVAAPARPELLALAGISFSMTVGTLIPVEALCDSPGLGQLAWQAALARDVPVIVNLTLLIAAVTAGANGLADFGRAAAAERAR